MLSARSGPVIDSFLDHGVALVNKGAKCSPHLSKEGQPPQAVIRASVLGLLQPVSLLAAPISIVLDIMEGKDNDPGQVASDSSLTAMLPGFSDEDAVDDNTLAVVIDVVTTKASYTWTEDDTAELYARVMQRKTEEATSSGASKNASKYWSIRQADDRTCHVELVDKPSEYSVLSKSNTDNEYTTFLNSIRGLGLYGIFDSGYPSLTLQTPSMNTKVPDIFSQLKKSCEHLTYRISELVMEELRQEKLGQLRQRIQNRLTLKTGPFSEIVEIKQAIVNQARKNDELAKRIEALEALNNEISTKLSKRIEASEATNTEMSAKLTEKSANLTEMASKLQFGKVLSEMERKDFGTILVQLALAQREAKATRLGFGKVFDEMKKKDFSRLLEEKSVARRNAKAVELVERLQLLQMEAQRAGIPLGALDIPIVMPEVVAVTGAVCQYSDDIPLATPVPKQI